MHDLVSFLSAGGLVVSQTEALCNPPASPLFECSHRIQSFVRGLNTILASEGLCVSPRTPFFSLFTRPVQCRERGLSVRVLRHAIWTLRWDQGRYYCDRDS